MALVRLVKLELCQHKVKTIGLNKYDESLDIFASEASKNLRLMRYQIEGIRKDDSYLAVVWEICGKEILNINRVCSVDLTSVEAKQPVSFSLVCTVDHVIQESGKVEKLVYDCASNRMVLPFLVEKSNTKDFYNNSNWDNSYYCCKEWFQSKEKICELHLSLSLSENGWRNFNPNT